MDVCRSEIAVVHGPNGIGKSTLLDCLSTRYVNWTGSISCPRNAYSYLPQSPQHPQTAPLSKIAPLVIGYKHNRYNHLLDVLDLTRVADRLPALLSGGELQRTRLLLALLRSHDILLLDEPFANMDARCRASLSVELERTRSSRATVLISHPADAADINVYGGMEFELQPPSY